MKGDENIPVLAGSPIQLRPFLPSMVNKEYLSWLHDPVVLRFSNQRFFSHTEESCKRYAESFLSNSSLFTSVHCISKENCIGTMTAYINDYHRTADIGIMIGDRNSWGKGYGLLAWRTMMSYLFNHYSLRKITGGTLSGNLPMLRIMERSGMILEGCRRQQELVEDTAFDALLFGVLSTEWAI